MGLIVLLSSTNYIGGKRSHNHTCKSKSSKRKKTRFQVFKLLKMVGQTPLFIFFNLVSECLIKEERRKADASGSLFKRKRRES